MKHLSGSGKVKEYEITIKLFYDDDNGDGLFKMIYNTINNAFYIPKTNLAHTHSLIYSRSFTLTLVYKYKVKFTTNRILIKVF